MEDYLRRTPYSNLSEEEKKRKSAKLNTINRNFICPVSLVLNFASAKRLCEKMVIKRFKLLPERDPIYFTPEEVARCLQSTSIAVPRCIPTTSISIVGFFILKFRATSKFFDSNISATKPSKSLQSMSREASSIGIPDFMAESTVFSLFSIKNHQIDFLVMPNEP